jgi:hypothetical protein
LIAIAHVRRQWQKENDKRLTEGGPVPTVLSFVAESTWAAVTMICELAEISFSRVREQLSTLVRWASESWLAEDDSECQKNILRWYRSKKVLEFMQQRTNWMSSCDTYASFAPFEFQPGMLKATFRTSRGKLGSMVIM